MPRIKVKYDESGDHCAATVDDIAEAITTAIESNFYVGSEKTVRVWLEIKSFADEVVRYTATVLKPGEPSFKITGTAIPRVAFYNEGFHVKKSNVEFKVPITKANLYLMIDWNLVET